MQRSEGGCLLVVGLEIVEQLRCAVVSVAPARPKIDKTKPRFKIIADKFRVGLALSLNIPKPILPYLVDTL